MPDSAPARSSERTPPPKAPADRGAAAADIKALMQLTLDRVRNHFGITLEPEMKTMGEI
jgi:hypothetical protein